ncbi:MAG TPA: hypothetical protein VHO06_28465 [Polyangia bacterium]|nr:hypothetical protein [Polyangia bacterium]
MSDASPRFRQDLTAAPAEADGVACVDVSDPKTGANFRLYDFEYQLALQLNGQPVAQVTDWASRTYGADLTADGIREFASRLKELGFLELDPDATAERPLSFAAAAATAPAEESTENAADEWMSPQGAKTATYVPDAAMLDSPPELTPVAPPDLGGFGLGRATGREATPAPVNAAPTAPAIVELPSDALDSEPAPAAALEPAPPAGLPPPAKPEPKPSWAADLDGALQSTDSPPAVKPPPAHSEPAPPVLPVSAAAPPPGLSERRQPPAPEAVVMSSFSNDAKRAPARRARSGRTAGLVAVAVLAAAAAVGYWVWSHRQAPAAPQALRVRAVTPAPTAVYRWFSGRGEVTDYETTPVAFANPGRLAELLPAGTEVAAGDVIGKLQGASGMEALLAHDRSRVGFYKQLRDSMRAAGNAPELRLAEAHLAEKQKLVDLALAGLAKYTVVAGEPGEVVETLATIGAQVAPGVPVARLKGRLLHGAFELDAQDRAALGRLDFCRIEVIGLGPHAANDPPPRRTPATAADSSPLDAPVPRFLDCKPPGGAAGEASKVEIPLPGDVGLVSGQPLRLARRRYDAVFPVPASALVADGDRKAVWIAGRDGAAELRGVTVADVGDDALVSEGLRVGDRVIVDPPSDLRPGARVELAP